MATAEEAPEIPEQLNAGQIARLLGISQQNVHPWLRRRGIDPVAEAPLPIGRLYDRAQVEAARLEFEASGGGPGGREADEKRRATARAKGRGADVA